MCASIYMPAPTPTLTAARDELARGLRGLLGEDARFCDDAADATLIVGTPAGALGLRNDDIDAGSPLFALSWMTLGGLVVDSVTVGARRARVIVATEEASFTACSILAPPPDRKSARRQGRPGRARPAHARSLGQPGRQHRARLRGPVALGLGQAAGDGFAALSRLRRANASIGINARRADQRQRERADPTAAYLRKVAALADVFRPWGIRVFLSARFSAPIEIGGLATADPLDARRRAWWSAKADEIFRSSPTSAASWSRPTPKASPAPRTTVARTPTARTCSPTRSPAPAAS